jgi:hypothetical protein
MATTYPQRALIRSLNEIRRLQEVVKSNPAEAARLKQYEWEVMEALRILALSASRPIQQNEYYAMCYEREQKSVKSNSRYEDNNCQSGA